MRIAPGRASWGIINHSIRIIYGGFTAGAIVHRKNRMENYGYRSSLEKKKKPPV